MLPYVSAPVGGASLRNAAVAANPTIGGNSTNAALIRASTYPRFRGTTSNSSMTLQIVGVSYLASAAIIAVEIMVRWADKGDRNPPGRGESAKLVVSRKQFLRGRTILMQIVPSRNNRRP